MNDLMNPFGQLKPAQSFDKIKISIASPELIRSWSFGEIKKPSNLITEPLDLKFILLSSEEIMMVFLSNSAGVI